MVRPHARRGSTNTEQASNTAASLRTRAATTNVLAAAPTSVVAVAVVLR